MSSIVGEVVKVQSDGDGDYDVFSLFTDVPPDIEDIAVEYIERQKAGWEFPGKPVESVVLTSEKFPGVWNRPAAWWVGQNVETRKSPGDKIVIELE